MADAMLVKTPGGRVRSMSQEDYDALRLRAEANLLPVGRQLDDEEEANRG